MKKPQGYISHKDIISVVVYKLLTTVMLEAAICWTIKFLWFYIRANSTIVSMMFDPFHLNAVGIFRLCHCNDNDL